MFNEQKIRILERFLKDHVKNGRENSVLIDLKYVIYFFISQITLFTVFLIK